jgi:MFS family permease
MQTPPRERLALPTTDPRLAQPDASTAGASPAPASSTAESSSPNKMPKVAFASFLGTVIEFYDFNIYATAAALVFAQAFFPAMGEYAGGIVTFATLGVAFVARPIGSILFGHFGDRLGRKRTLIATMTLMGTATVLIGLLPTAASIGVVAPILLVTLRIAQGIAAGGEWAGAALFTSENAPEGSRGFWACFTNVGGAFANILALSTFLATGLLMSDQTFVDWGWRIPFILSMAIVAVGLYVRLSLEETPVFARAAENDAPSTLPFKEALTNSWREILLGAGAIVVAFAFGYIGIAYLTNYGTVTLDLGKNTVLAAGVVGNLINAACMISAGLISDRIGRRPVLIGVAIAAVPWSLLLFPLLDTGTAGAFWLGVAITFAIAGHGFGMAGSFLSELFETRYRCTAAGLAYSLAAILGGGVPPLVASVLIGKFGTFSFGLFLAAYAVVSLACALLVHETRTTDLEDETIEARAV